MIRNKKMEKPYGHLLYSVSLWHIVFVFVMGKTNNFPGPKNETETETFILGLVGSRPRPRLSCLVSWN